MACCLYKVARLGSITACHSPDHDHCVSSAKYSKVDFVHDFCCLSHNNSLCTLLQLLYSVIQYILCQLLFRVQLQPNHSAQIFKRIILHTLTIEQKQIINILGQVIYDALRMTAQISGSTSCSQQYPHLYAVFDAKMRVPGHGMPPSLFC